MEKLVKIPFDVEIAKKITNENIKGKIIDNEYNDYRIVCFNMLDKEANIIGLRKDDDHNETALSFNNNGICKQNNYYKLSLKIPEYLTFKDGDIIVFGEEKNCLSIGIFKKCNDVTHSCYVVLLKDGLVFNGCDWTYNNSRFATEEEKQKFIKLLKQSKEPQVKEYLKKFFNIEEYKFTPFEKVLVRNSEHDNWEARFFNRIHKNLYGCTDSNFYKYCITYNNDTEHLLGTNKNI